MEVESPCVLVTGANGFLGAHLVRALLAHGARVVATCRRSSMLTRLDMPSKKMLISYLDVTKRDDIAECFAKFKPAKIYNCAAYGVNYRDQDARIAFDVNVRAAFDLVEEAAFFGVQRFIHLGSCFEYGSKQGLIREDATLQPTAIYGATKASSTLLLLQRARDCGLALTVLRPFSLWGPLESSYRLVPQIINACLTGSPLALTAGEQQRDYSFVGDVANWITRIGCLNVFPSGQIVNLGSGPVMLRDFVIDIANILDGAHLLRFDRLPYRPNEMMQLLADTSKMHALLGDVVRTPLAVGVREMISKEAV